MNLIKETLEKFEKELTERQVIVFKRIYILEKYLWDQVNKLIEIKRNNIHNKLSPMAEEIYKQIDNLGSDFNEEESKNYSQWVYLTELLEYERNKKQW